MAIELVRSGETITVEDRLPVLPLRDVVLYPYVVMPLLVGRAGSLAAVDAALAGQGHLLLVTQKRGDVQDPAASDLYRTGVVARIQQSSRLANGTVKVLVEGVAAVRVTRYATAAAVLRATVAPVPLDGFADAPGGDHPEARRTLALFEEYVSLQRRLPPEILTLVQGLDSEERQAWAIAAHLFVRLDARQRLLEERTLAGLFDALSTHLRAEVELLQLERKIDDEVRGSLFQNQREFYLQEQLKAIHRELGHGGDDDDFAELEAQLERDGVPDPVRARARRELRKLRRTPALSPEATVVRNYLDWIAGLPWSERTDDVVDVERARVVLDEDHHGLAEVKDRILDYIAVLSLVGRLEGPILCLVGPPGVGKTSLGRSIARALGRKFVRMSLGGVRDEAEIRGHRRTYIGAMPGRVIQAMRRAEVMNPVILLDEVDKLGHDHRGDPAAALLEVLDPEQNRAFNDHYLEVDYDLSQVLFVTTANSLAQIPEALRDRMELIRLPGYLDQEKYAIARQFLIPKQLRLHGLGPERVTWAPEALPAIVHRYTREAGVRELERRLARVARKLARRVTAATAGGPGGPAEAALAVTEEDLRALLGTAPYDPSETTRDDKVGVATGLAYTHAGGDVLEVEVSVVGGRGRLQLTGTLGDVMKESASAAMSYTRGRAGALGIDREFHRTRDVHVHIPDGATPKDGPSAGIAIATALASALSGIPVRGDLAMTGELTLRGRVLPIGGLKEKAVAAHRHGIRDVIIPHANLRELDDLPTEVRDGVRFHGVQTMDEVLPLALRGAGAREEQQAAVAVPH